MKNGVFLVFIFATLLSLSNIAEAAVSVSFGSDITVGEGVGNILVTLKRTGDLNTVTAVYFSEKWQSATLSENELLFNHHTSPSNIVYNSDRSATVFFYAGVSQVNIPYSVTDDQELEDTEYVDFKIDVVSDSSGNASVGKEKIRISIQDNDGGGQIPFVGIYPGVIVDEGNPTRSFLVLSEPTNHIVTLKVSTNRNTYKEANYPNQDDYQEVYSQQVIIPAGNDFAWFPVQTHQNNDENDKTYESFALCIDSGSVSGAAVDVPCAKVTIKDVPTTNQSDISSVIFGDGTGNGWTDSSWGVVQNFGQVSYDGTSAIEADFTYPWSGLSYSTNGFNTKNYDTLSFAIKGSNTSDGSEVLAVVYLADGSVNNVPLSNYLQNGVLNRENWQVIHIPLSDFSAKNTSLNQVVFENGAAGTLFIDDLSFLSFAGVCQ